VSSSEPVLSVDRLSARWGRVPVLQDVSFEVRDGELLALMGPNGSGKTTLLRCLAGLEPIAGGTVRLGRRDLRGVPPHRRGIGLMFQEPALFAHRTVLENVGYAPLLKRRPRAEVEGEVRELLELVRLRGYEDRRADALSGGERQRVALARTLAARPRLVLLDEPFAALDVELKAELRAEFRDVLRARGVAAVHVTHDREEGLFLGDRVALLFDGVLSEPGSPEQVFAAPVDARAAGFLGYNLVRDGSGWIAVRPEEVRLVSPGAGDRAGTVVADGTTGRERLTVVRLASGERIEARRASDERPCAPGRPIAAAFDRIVRLPAAAAPSGSKEPKNAGDLPTA
jgi:thiamine transport system ATP-binding protein